MINAQARRLGLPALANAYSDTWNIAERFLVAENYRLETLARRLQLGVKPTHRATDDVVTTAALLTQLMPHVRKDVVARQRLVRELGAPFATLAGQLGEWRLAMATLRPADLLGRVLDESGLREYFTDDYARLANLSQLISIFDTRDDRNVHSETALRSLLEFSSLARNMDLVSETDRKVAAITVHQAKGMEFDTVFIAGAEENEMPSWYSLREGTVEEERHLFYVALTRAKERLFISGHVRSERGFTNPPSQFLDVIDLVR
jgi:DNA helicase-2/ATP-dependent DNA helicase PcrA